MGETSHAPGSDPAGNSAALVRADAPKSPSVSTFLENRNGEVGILRCKVDSHPRAELAFFKGGQRLAASQPSRATAGQRFLAVPSYNGLRLEIQGVTAEDSGHYTCQARNPLGSSTGTVHFNAESESDLGGGGAAAEKGHWGWEADAHPNLQQLELSGKAGVRWGQTSPPAALDHRQKLRGQSEMPLLSQRDQGGRSGLSASAASPTS